VACTQGSRELDRRHLASLHYAGWKPAVQSPSTGEGVCPLSLWERERLSTAGGEETCVLAFCAHHSSPLILTFSQKEKEPDDFLGEGGLLADSSFYTANEL
jgi:hypothetical protein